jgi:hypothetical protein
MKPWSMPHGHGPWAWAESTRIYPPEGSDDAMNHLLECAQSLFNEDINKPARAPLLTDVERRALQWALVEVRAGRSLQGCGARRGPRFEHAETRARREAYPAWGREDRETRRLDAARSRGGDAGWEVTVGDLVHLVGASKGDGAVYLVIAGPFANRVQVTYCGSERWYMPVWQPLDQVVKVTAESKHTRRARRWLDKEGFEPDGWRRISVGRYGAEQRVTVDHISMLETP